ncbi:MAG: MBL fold metallo-hydrolase [Rikenellaceae bacterium]
MKLTILGSGTSQGVPTIGCRCKVCRSTDPRDNRLRSSAMIEGDGFRFIIDAGPDFRQQMLRAGVRRVDAVLLTHEHKDHVGGIDDLRALNFVDYPTIHKINIYATAHTLETVRKDYDYAFAVNKYRGVPELELVAFDPMRSFEVCGVEVVPITGAHSTRFTTTGYRIGNVAYLTDFSEISPEEEAKLDGVELLVVNALRYAEHPSHFNVAQALELIARVRPLRAYLTHMSHDIGLYAETNALLPNGVELAYDGLEIEI